jgi:hypothetical protein
MEQEPKGKLRTVQIYINNKWTPIDFTELHKNDIFRMFEPDGTPVKGNTGSVYFLATSELYDHDEYHVPTIEVEDLEEI